MNGRLGGSNDNPGIAAGTGSGPRDAQLWRSAANTWYTPDTFHVAVLDVDAAGQASSRTNLGIDAAIEVVTQAEYDALATPDSGTLYVISG